jgi:hypothetical protein
VHGVCNRGGAARTAEVSEGRADVGDAGGDVRDIVPRRSVCGNACDPPRQRLETTVSVSVSIVVRRAANSTTVLTCARRELPTIATVQ